MYDERNPQQSRYRCRLCYKHYHDVGLQEKYRQNIGKREGILKPTYKDNYETILSHFSSSSHAHVVQALQQQSANRLPTDFDEINRKESEIKEGALKVTTMMIRLVYSEVKKNSTFSTHPDSVACYEANGVNMGYHHWDRMSALRMAELISSTMHNTVIDVMRSKNTPISIIIDGSADVSGYHYLITYFQFVYDNVVYTQFYRLIQTSSDESAEGLFRSIKNSIQDESDDLLSYVKQNLVGFVSDGAAVMVGRYNGVIQHFFTNKPIFGVHCMAHRLQRVIVHSFK